MSDELKPCPFCGARAACSVGNASFSGVELMGAGTDRPYVWCGTCGSSGSFEDTDAKAVATWNTRTDLADALAAALKPIAAEADAWEGCDAIDRIVESLGGYSGEMTVGDLRRAAAALAAWEARK